MSILSYNDDKANWIVSRYLKESTLSCNPVIAGGFPLYIHKAISDCNTDEDWSLFINENFLGRGCAPHKTKRFSDIDIWFLRDNSWSSILLDNVSEAEGDGKAFSSKEFGAMIGFDKPYKVTSWSNSYFYSKLQPDLNLNPGVYKEYQVIKRSFSSIKDLLNDFDFVNCSVAWHDGLMYYNEGLVDAFKKGELRYNKKPEIDDDDFIGRVFHAVRSFKYASRYNLSFDNEIADFIFKTFFESKEFCSNTLNKKERILVSTNTASSYGLYGLTSTLLYPNEVADTDEAAHEKWNIVCLIETFYNYYALFSRMSSFKKEWNFYIMDIPYLKYSVINDIDKDSRCKYNVTCTVSDIAF